MMMMPATLSSAAVMWFGYQQPRMANWWPLTRQNSKLSDLCQKSLKFAMGNHRNLLQSTKQRWYWEFASHQKGAGHLQENPKDLADGGGDDDLRGGVENEDDRVLLGAGVTTEPATNDSSFVHNSQQH
jgi:hypothetical protein